MKKSDFILIGAVVLVVLVALISTKGTKAEEEIDYPLTLAGDAGLHQMTYNDYETMVDNGDAFIVVIERAGCGYCIQYMPIVEEVANEKGIPMYYIDTDTLSTEEMNNLNNNNSFLKRNSWGTPTTLFMLGDRVIDTISGYADKETVLSFIGDRVVVGE